MPYTNFGGGGDIKSVTFSQIIISLAVARELISV